MATETVRTTVVLPKKVAQMLKEHVPAGQRSQFIAESIEQRLLVRELPDALQLEAFEKAFQKYREVFRALAQ